MAAGAASGLVMRGQEGNRAWVAAPGSASVLLWGTMIVALGAAVFLATWLWWATPRAGQIANDLWVRRLDLAAGVGAVAAAVAVVALNRDPNAAPSVRMAAGALVIAGLILVWLRRLEPWVGLVVRGTAAAVAVAWAVFLVVAAPALLLLATVLLAAAASGAQAAGPMGASGQLRARDRCR
jgi:hypothetical protein